MTEIQVTFKPNAPFRFTIAQNHPSGSCRIATSEHNKIKVHDRLYCLNNQPIPRGLKTTEVMGILKIAQRPFVLTLLRETGSESAKTKSVKSLWSQKNKSAGLTSSSNNLQEELNVVLGKDEWAPLGMTFQTCTDGSHKIIFVDPEGQGGYAGIAVGDFIVGVNYKPLSFGYTHDEVVKLIRGTPKPFTLNTVRKKPDEVSGLVGQVKTSMAAIETIAAKDEEIGRLQAQLAEARSEAEAADSVTEELAQLKAEVTRLHAELAKSHAQDAAVHKMEEQFELIQKLVPQLLAQQQNSHSGHQQPLQDATNVSITSGDEALSALKMLVDKHQQYREML